MLNEQQQDFQKLVLSGEAKKILLLGEAGTGKTYTIIDTILKLLEAGKSVVVAAPTHAALNTIKSKMPLVELFEDYDISFVTVASLLARYGVKSATGEVYFRSPQPTAKLHTADCIVIDEISMLSIKEQNELLATNAQVIFTGDLSQIPVVLQQAANWSEANEKLKDLTKITFTIQERQEGDIYELALKCRDTIYYPTKEDSGISIVEDSQTLLESLVAQMKEVSTDEYIDFRFLSYRNVEVDYANLFVHQKLFGKEPFYVNEYIMLRSTGSFGYNGEIVKINSILEVNYSELYGVTEYTVEINGNVVTLLSQEDLKKIATKRIGVVELLKSSLAAGNQDAVQSYHKELDILDGFVCWQYQYATTIHKAQGATVPHVFLDISSFKSASNKRALLYVGISRASSTLTATTLPPRYVPKRKNKAPNLSIWKCTITGKTSTAAGLAKYHKKLGINSAENRVFVGKSQK